MGKNKIASVPEGISKLIFLQELDLGKNKLDAFPGGIVELVNLKQLVLNQNYIEGIPYMIKNLQKLEYLDMWSNNLNSFPESLNELKKLKEFDLRVIQFTKDEKEELQRYFPIPKFIFHHLVTAALNCIEFLDRLFPYFVPPRDGSNPRWIKQNLYALVSAPFLSTCCECNSGKKINYEKSGWQKFLLRLQHL